MHAGWYRDFRIGADAEAADLNVGRNAETRSLSIYIDTTSGPLSDVRVRQAISKGFDRDLVIELASQGTARQSFVVPAGEPGAIEPDESTPNYTYDPEGAVALLEEAGQPNPIIPLTYASDASFALDVPMVEVMKEQLSEVGIDLQLDPKPWGDIIGNMLSGTWTGMMLVPGIAQPDPLSYFQFLAEGSPLNKSDDATANEMWQAIATATDEDSRQQAVDELQVYVADQVLVLIPYTQTQRQEIWTDEVMGYSADPYTWRIHLKDAWVVPE